MLSQDLLDILACPVCKEKLLADHPAQQLRCTHCGAVYPVVDNIPILLPNTIPPGKNDALC